MRRDGKSPTLPSIYALFLKVKYYVQLILIDSPILPNSSQISSPFWSQPKEKASAKTILSSFTHTHTHTLFFKQPSCNNLVWTDTEQTAKRLLNLLHNMWSQMFWLIII